MKILRIILYLILWCVCLQGCIGVAYDKKLTDGYYLLAMDSDMDMQIIYKDDQDYMFSVVNATVFAVAQNENYIIVKQHPRDFPEEADKSIVNYFIIPLKNKISDSFEKNIFGPFPRKEFEQKRKELNIERVDFNIVFSNLE